MKVLFDELQRRFENKEIVLSAGSGKAPMNKYAYATVVKGDRNSVEVTFFNEADEELYSGWGEEATFNDFNASEVGFYERNGLSVEYVARGVTSSRNIIAKLNVKSDTINRVDCSSEKESSYFQDRLNERYTCEQLDSTDHKEINDYIAELYYDIIL
jgi:hypothetical protein